MPLIERLETEHDQQLEQMKAEREESIANLLAQHAAERSRAYATTEANEQMLQQVCNDRLDALQSELAGVRQDYELYRTRIGPSTESYEKGKNYILSNLEIRVIPSVVKGFISDTHYATFSVAIEGRAHAITTIDTEDAISPIIEKAVDIATQFIPTAILR